MRQLEKLLGAVSALLFFGTCIIALMWIGYTAVSLAKGSTETPIATQQTANEPVAAAAVKASPASVETTPPAAAEPAATAPKVAAVSAAQGEKVFKKCKACHVAKADGKNKTGPNLWGVVGRQIAATEGFKYSAALQEKAAEIWDVAQLKAFLAKPKKHVPGTSMSFAGLKKDADLANVIAYLGQQSDTPQDVVALGLAAAGAETVPAADPSADDQAEEIVEIEPVPYPEGVTYANPPTRTEAEIAGAKARAAELAETAATLDYERARFHPIHFPPMIEQASNEECLVCHQEILDHKPRASSPAGVQADDTLAWYQTLDTYQGDQASFHYRHLESDFAKEVMNLECTFCHKGNDPREETPDMMIGRAPLSASTSPEFTLRKMVNPSDTCLRCHGAMPDPVEIMGLEGPWHEVRADMEYPEAPNGCLSCHAESFRTERHAVTYLNAENIEKIGREGSSDSCYGCHGGRAWYRNAYPYPRHDWPDMDTETPDWAADRPTESDPAYALPASE